MVVRVAPIAAAGTLALAFAARLVGGSPLWPLLVWLIAMAWLALEFRRAGRALPSTDQMAAQADADAALGGELRSAHWFALSPTADAWTEFHLTAAATRAGAIAWSAIYPPVPVRRAGAVSGVLSLAAIIVMLGGPRYVFHSATRPDVALAADADADMDAMPPELQARLAELSALVARGDISAQVAGLDLQQSATFASLDPTKRQALLKRLEQVAENRSADAKAQVLTTPGQAADDQKWARDNQALRQASLAQQEGQKTDPSAPGAQERPRDDSSKSDASADKAMMGQAKPGAVAVRLPNGEEQAASMRVAGNAPISGDPGSSYGGQHGDDGPPRRPDTPQIVAALVKETVDANMNAPTGDRKDDERRRSTEQGTSALSYTRTTGRGSYDRVRADAPRVVPEARRLMLERYFVRNEVPR